MVTDSVVDLLFSREINTLVVDIDGTLAETTGRIPNRLSVEEAIKFNWAAYAFDMAHNPPPLVHCGIAELLRAWRAKRSVQFVYCTGRQTDVRDLTQHWLIDNGFPVDFALCLMRDAGDFRDSGEIKRHLLQRQFQYGYDHMLAIDDDDGCLEVFQQMGLKTWKAPACWELLAKLGDRGGFSAFCG